MNAAFSPTLRGPGRLLPIAWAIATVGIACGGGSEPGHVSIPDRNLRALIESHLAKAAGSPIHEWEMLTLQALVATPASYERGGIADLEGLQYATNLEELDVSAERWDSAAERWHNLNDLSDLSPLAGLTKLETLDLSGSNSRITDISPLSGLTGLRRLDLWNAWITDLEPLAGMRELEFLDLTSNDRLSDLSPLSGLTKLRDLRLSYNAISDITPLANLTDLARLNVSHNRIGDLTPLANLTGLGILSVDGADLSDLEPLAAFGGLVYLSAGSCTRWLPRRSRCGAPPDLTSLSGLRELRTLLLHDNNISDPAPLADLPNLDALSLYDNNISDLAPLSSLARLRYLNLSGNGIFDVAPLVANAGLGEGAEIDVRGNFLAKTSVDVHIPDLEARGVDVAYDRVPAVDGPLIYNDNVFVPEVEKGLSGRLTVPEPLPSSVYARYAKRVYEYFEDAFDFLIFVSNRESVGTGTFSFVNIHLGISNNVRGIGRPTFSDGAYYGSAGRLRSIVHLGRVVGLGAGPALHEIMHRWGNNIVSASANGPPHHWGFSSANGILGGFDIADLVDLGDGRYSAGDISSWGWAANIRPYSPIELYLAGMASLGDVPDLWVAEDGAWLRNDNRSVVETENGERIFTARKIKMYTIGDIVAEHGARVPDASQAQRSFRAMAILLTDDGHPATMESLETVSADVAWFSHPGEDGIDEKYNFFEATGGRGTMKMDGLSKVERRDGQGRPRRAGSGTKLRLP